MAALSIAIGLQNMLEGLAMEKSTVCTGAAKCIVLVSAVHFLAGVYAGNAETEQ